MLPVHVAYRFVLSAKLGAGGFGEVYSATDAVTGSKVAVKLEHASCPRRCLAREVQAYMRLGAWPAQQTERFPGLQWFGVHEDLHVLVSELLGPSLQNLLQVCGGMFSLTTVLGLADQMLDCVERVHAAGLVHRDLKPCNFCVGLGAQMTTVKLIDFGLAGSWQHPVTKQHISYGKTVGWTGTVPYLSLNAHCRVQQTRRDDLESLGYVLLRFLQGSLPWLGLKAEDFKATQRLVMFTKYKTSIESLCHPHPEEFATYLAYCRGLAFSDLPDYYYLRSLFRELRGGCAESCSYDWMLLSTGASADGFVSNRQKVSGNDSTTQGPPCSFAAPHCSGSGWSSNAADPFEPS
eukprot:CAMPEP_0115267430 /NCGR_PEP_ID=MMETSP0270-20121206/51987_1 /TAXON_ID=71861 /ORGANISM="Scrippsiella trochoidea, Strain CCMP3099" /LENGTH=348 /DNA_ID=CAMNT_0002683573 /DNA_START=43 /DNA_END=1086 /DNA_ORIENTATION=+